jgi:hypothetical protein
VTDDELVTWQQVADLLPPDVVAAIVAGPPPSPMVRYGRALAAWYVRPRGSAAVVASVGEGYAASIRAAMGK